MIKYKRRGCEKGLIFRLVGYIFYLIAAVFLLTGFMEVVFVKDLIHSINFNMKCTIGLVSLIIGTTVLQIWKLKQKQAS